MTHHHHTKPQTLIAHKRAWCYDKNWTTDLFWIGQDEQERCSHKIFTSVSADPEMLTWKTIWIVVLPSISYSCWRDRRIPALSCGGPMKGSWGKSSSTMLSRRCRPADEVKIRWYTWPSVVGRRPAGGPGRLPPRFPKNKAEDAWCELHEKKY